MPGGWGKEGIATLLTGFDSTGFVVVEICAGCNY